METKWTKTTWKAFEEIIRRGRNRSVKAYLVTDDDDDDDDDDDEDDDDDDSTLFRNVVKFKHF
jgi:hypothetical protein